MATRLYRDFNALKTYGKEPESLTSIISLFNEALAEYTFEEINKAMTEHVKQSPEFPTPYDIIVLANADRKQKLEEQNRIIPGVDDTIEKLRGIRIKIQSDYHSLTPKEQRVWRESGWRLGCE